MTQKLGHLFIDGENLPILDISGSNITITNNGVTLDTNIKKYGNSSLYLDRENDDHLTLEESDIFDILDNQAMTFDVWVYPKDLTTTPRQEIFEAGYGPRWFLRLDKPVIEFRRGSNHSTSVRLLSADFSYLTENSWNHVAITRSASGFFTMYVNGVSIDTEQYGTQILTTGTSRVGTYGNTVDPFFGNIDNLRLVKDEVLWTENFDLTEEALFYKSDDAYVRPDNITGLYGIGSRGNLRGKASEGFIRPTVKQFFTSKDFEEVASAVFTPTTFDSTRAHASLVITNNDLTLSSMNNLRTCRTVYDGATTGKYYWEETNGTHTGINSDIGIYSEDSMVTYSYPKSYPGRDITPYSLGYRGNGSMFYNMDSYNYSTYGDSYDDNDIIGVALNLDDFKINFSKNGVWQGEISIASGKKYFPGIGKSSSTVGFTATANFGQSSFQYDVPENYEEGFGGYE